MDLPIVIGGLTSWNETDDIATAEITEIIIKQRSTNLPAMFVLSHNECVPFMFNIRAALIGRYCFGRMHRETAIAIAFSS